MITLNDISLTAGSFRLSGINLRVPAGSYGILMGATASGKTTILEAIAGLKPTVSGSILLGERNVTDLRPSERNIGYLPQDGALFSKMNVRNNLAFSLEVRGASPTLIQDRIDELSSLLGIQHLLPRGIRELSGGEKQRVALGRALASHPETLLLDEPLSALDELTRQNMYALLKSIQRNTGVTVLHVTHHIADAAILGDTLLYLTSTGTQQISLGELHEMMKINEGASPTPDAKVL